MATWTLSILGALESPCATMCIHTQVSILQSLRKQRSKESLHFAYTEGRHVQTVATTRNQTTQAPLAPTITSFHRFSGKHHEEKRNIDKGSKNVTLVTRLPNTKARSKVGSTTSSPNNCVSLCLAISLGSGCFRHWPPTALTPKLASQYPCVAVQDGMNPVPEPYHDRARTQTRNMTIEVPSFLSIIQIWPQ